MIFSKFGGRLTKTSNLFREYKWFMDSLEGKTLVDVYGNQVIANSILKHKKYVVYYFSASWCTACKGLLPKLKKIYKESCKRHIPLEIIYISLDTQEDEMLKYFKEKHGSWYAIPFGDDTIHELRLRFGVTHIPYIAVVKHDGTIISRNGRTEIDELGLNVLVTWTD